MKIGLDLSVIQTPHRMRGIGATAINFVNNLSDELKKQHEFVIYLYEAGQAEALELLVLTGLRYEIRYLVPDTPFMLKLPGRLKIINGLLNNVKKVASIYTGDPRIKDLSDVDSFLQFDQSAPLPRSSNIKTALILYDIIPYVLESYYLWSYKTARRLQDSRKSALRKHMHRVLYKFKLKAVAKRADALIAISKHTKDDFVKYLKLPASRIQVVHLGIKTRSPEKAKYPEFKKFIENAWGYFPKPIDLREKPFLLFVGGADPRRRINDLVAAFNNLRAQGQDMRLVMAGDTMKGPHAIPIMETQKYLADSSYLDDIVFLGFITEEQKNWLYQNALAFIYPSVYEGFGLPILEAMRYGTPVITYDNSSIREIADDAVLYAQDYLSIMDNVKQLIDDKTVRGRLAKSGTMQASKFSWASTARDIVECINEV